MDHGRWMQLLGLIPEATVEVLLSLQQRVTLTVPKGSLVVGGKTSRDSFCSQHFRMSSWAQLLE